MNIQVEEEDGGLPGQHQEDRPRGAQKGARAIDGFINFVDYTSGCLIRFPPSSIFQITEKAQQLEEELATTKTQLEESQKELARLRQEFDEKTVEVRL